MQLRTRSSRPKITATILSLVGVLMALPVQASVPKSQSHASQVTITLYSGQHPQTTASLVSAFEAKTGINVQVREDDEDVLADQIVTEGTRSPADVFFTENTPALQLLQEKGLLAKLASSTLSKVPGKYSSTAHDWVGVSARTSVIVYNTNELKASQVPSSILDLADKKWAGKLAIAPGETDFQPIITSVALKYGQAKALSWLAGLKANAGGRNYPDNETLVAKVNSGAAELGVINHYYWYRLQSEIGPKAIHSALHYLNPGDAGYVLDVSGAAVLKSSKHQAAAQQLVSFLVGEQGQTIISKSFSFEYPLGSGVQTTKPLKPFSSLRPTPLTLNQLGDGSTAVSLLQRAGLL